jgi:hypothetical protein
MSIDLNNDYKKAESQINAYNVTTETQKTIKERSKQKSGNSFEKSKSETSKGLNEVKDASQRLQDEVKNQYEKLIDLFKISAKSSPNQSSDTMDFLVKQILGASQNTKSRISEIFIEEVLSTAGCSEEQTFVPGVDGNKIYVRVNQIDLKKILNKNPEEGNNALLYETKEPTNGLHPYPMDKQLYNRLQQEGQSFSSEYGQSYIGGSSQPIMDIKYVTSYVQNGVTYYGDYYEVTLLNRTTGNSVSDFLRDYYSSINILDFDDFTVKLLNSLTNVVDIDLNITKTEKEGTSKFQTKLNRILGLCFDSNQEIDVSGTAKQSVLDNLDESFFELTSTDLKNIENQVNNTSDGVTEFEDCGNIKLPVNTRNTIKNLYKIREVPDNKKVQAIIDTVDDTANDEEWKRLVPSGINLKISLKNDLLKLIPQTVVLSMLSPKSLLGAMVVLKSVGSTSMDEVEDYETFTVHMKSFLINLTSKISAIFVEELFNLLKANIRKLVELLSMEILREAKDARVKTISAIIFVLIQLGSIVVDWKKCKSVIDEILKLLNLSSQTGFSRLPTFTLAASGLLGGFSPTRAFANVTERYQEAGIPVGPMPDGSPNLMQISIFENIKAQRDEQLANSKTEVFIPPLAVAAIGAGTTLPGRGIGKTY